MFRVGGYRRGGGQYTHPPHHMGVYHPPINEKPSIPLSPYYNSSNKPK